MKVICVRTDYDGDWSSFSSKHMLSLDKWYDVINEGPDFYTIIWNNGYQANLSKKYFKTLEELRQEKLTELGV